MCLKRFVVLTLCVWIGCSCSFKINAVWANDIVVVEKTMIITAYYKPCENQRKYATGSYEAEIRLNGTGELTSSETVPRVGTVAADQRIFPKGTILYIPGYGLGTVEDKGGKIKGNRLDVFFGECDLARELAMNFGTRKRVKVKIISKG